MKPVKISELPFDEMSRVILSRLHADARNLAPWRKAAIEAFKMRSGDQWNEWDRMKLQEEDRPAVAFNRIEAGIDAVAGIDVATERTILPVPRDTQSAEINEAFAGAIQFIRDETFADSEETDAFADALTCGIGAVSIWIDMLSEEDPSVRISHVGILDTLWDSTAKQRNLFDARWVAYNRLLDSDTIASMFPDWEGTDDRPFIAKTAETMDDPIGELFESFDTSPAFDDPRDDYGSLNDLFGAGKSKMSSLHPVIEFQWYELEKRYRLPGIVASGDENDRSLLSLTEDQFKQLELSPEEKQLAYESWKKVYWHAFLIDGKVVKAQRLFYGRGFTLMFTTGKYDSVKHQFYGLVRNMVDPQRWANKFFSLIIDIIARNAKGGAFAEIDAFVDIRKAETDWSKSSPLILLKRGGLGRVQERAMHQYPTGIERMLEFAMEAVRDISGINLEILGMANRRQAGVVETERKRSVLGILALYFDNLRRMRILVGRALIDLVPRFIPPDKMVLIDIENTKRPIAMQDIYAQNKLSRYDVVVDESPTSANVKERAWFAIQQIMPQLLSSGIPIPPSVVDYMPIPKALADEWRRALVPLYEMQLAQTVSSIAEAGYTATQSAVGSGQVVQEAEQNTVDESEGPPSNKGSMKNVPGGTSPQNENQTMAMNQAREQRWS